MIEPVLQFLALLPCLGLLYLLWRDSARPESFIGRLVTFGFLLRAFLGLLLFWISYLNLAPGKSLQLGNGFWFFGLDSLSYHGEAVRLANMGLQSILEASKTLPSVVFIQTLAIFTFAFGASPAVGLLLNLFCYAGACRILTGSGAQRPAQEKAKIFAIAAISLSPGGIVWALQPLKDCFFVFLIVAFVAGCVLWQRAWSSSEYPRAVMAGLVMMTTIYALSGIRWYVAFMLLMALTVFFALSTAFARKRGAAAVAAVVVFYLLSIAFSSAGGPYVPDKIRRSLAPSTLVSEIAGLPSFLASSVEGARWGSDHNGGTTIIGQGKLVTSIVVPAARVSVPTTVPVPDLPTSLVARLLTGVAAISIPRSIGQPLGIFKIGGGRGLWLFADADTIAFDIVLAGAVLFLIRSRRGSFSSPTFWMLILLVPLVAGALFYTVSNFGTLFRLREIVYTLLALLPLGAASALSAATGPAADSDNDERQLTSQVAP